MADQMAIEEVRVVGGGTDNRPFVVDLRSVDEQFSGREAARLLDLLGTTLNFNPVPFDPLHRSPAAGRASAHRR